MFRFIRKTKADDAYRFRYEDEYGNTIHVALKSDNVFFAELTVKGKGTVIVDGKSVNSCLFPAPLADGCEILTIEGLEKNGEMDRIQKSFIRHGAVQCGFCSPGMIMSAYSLLKENPNPTEDEIRRAISGNLCRCTGYQQIVDAIREL